MNVRAVRKALGTDHLSQFILPWTQLGLFIVGAGSAAGDGNSGQSYIEITRLNSANNTAGVGGICCEAQVVNAGNASARTKIYGTGGFYLSGGSIAVMRFYGQRTLAQDTDAVRFFFSSGNIASGKIRLYGIP